MADLKSLKLTTASDAGIGGDLTGITDNATEAAIVISSDEEVTMPLQPAFLAYASAMDNNVTGTATITTVGFDTEVFDQGGDFASNTFTAPVTGRYLLSAAVRYNGATVACVTENITIITSNRNYVSYKSRTFSAHDGNVCNATAVTDMDAGDTATVTLALGGEASDLVDIQGSAGAATRFSGCLLA